MEHSEGAERSRTLSYSAATGKFRTRNTHREPGPDTNSVGKIVQQTGNPQQLRGARNPSRKY
jgi:hypothetical protein